MLNIEELGQDQDGIQVEVYAMPRAEQTTTAGVEPKLHETMSGLAGHAKEKKTAKPVFDNTCRINCAACSPAFVCATPKSR